MIHDYSQFEKSLNSFQSKLAQQNEDFDAKIKSAANDMTCCCPFWISSKKKEELIKQVRRQFKTINEAYKDNFNKMLDFHAQIGHNKFTESQKNCLYKLFDELKKMFEKQSQLLQRCKNLREASSLKIQIDACKQKIKVLKKMAAPKADVKRSNATPEADVKHSNNEPQLDKRLDQTDVSNLQEKLENDLKALEAELKIYKRADHRENLIDEFASDQQEEMVSHNRVNSEMIAWALEFVDMYKISKSSDFQFELKEKHVEDLSIEAQIRLRQVSVDAPIKFFLPIATLLRLQGLMRDFHAGILTSILDKFPDKELQQNLTQFGKEYLEDTREAIREKWARIIFEGSPPFFTPVEISYLSKLDDISLESYAKQKGFQKTYLIMFKDLAILVAPQLRRHQSDEKGQLEEKVSREVREPYLVPRNPEAPQLPGNAEESSLLPGIPDS